MELELKDIAPYLPYGLMCELKDQGEIKVAELCVAYADNSYAFFDTVESEHGYDSIKPILRLLSDLTKIEFNALTDTSISYLTNCFLEKRKVNYDMLPYRDFVRLLENHFDVFGLIEKGLAIDINSLK